MLIHSEAQLNSEYHAENRPQGGKRLFDTDGRRFADGSSSDGAVTNCSVLTGIGIKANKNDTDGNTGQTRFGSLHSNAAITE